MINNTAHKLSHSTDPQTSRDAAEKLVKSGRLSKQQEGVFNDISRYIVEAHHKDFTAKELAKWLCGNKINNYYTISRRLNELEKKGKTERVYIGYSLVKRDNCAVWKLK